MSSSHIRFQRRSTISLFFSLMIVSLLAGLALYLPGYLSNRKTNTVSLANKGNSLVFPKCQYEIQIFRKPQSLTEFTFSAPNEVITPVRFEGIAAGSMEDLRNKKLTVIPGPFPWRPQTGSGWGYTHTFAAPPQIVMLGMLVWVGDTQEIRNACGFWQEILPSPTLTPTPTPTPTPTLKPKHTECRIVNRLPQCVQVTGPGVNQCRTDRDCQKSPF